MPIELSLFLCFPPERGTPRRLPTANAVPQTLEGAGSRLGDALDLAAAFGRPHNDARALFERATSTIIGERMFLYSELPPLIELVEDVIGRLPAYFDSEEKSIWPQAEVLISSGVCVESFGRLVLRRSEHGLARVLEDLKEIDRFLLWALANEWNVVCDFESGCPEP